MRTLLIRPGAIGECLLSFPVLEQLRSEFTEVWAPGAVVGLVDFANQVRSLAATGIDTFGIGELPRPRSLTELLSSFDRVVSWYGANRPDFVRAFRELQPRTDFHRALPPTESTLHATDYFAQQAGVSPGGFVRLDLAHVRKRQSVVMHPFSGSPRKNWPLERFEELATLLPLPVEWSAGPEERLKDATRFDDLRALAEWIDGCRLYVGNDSGITHLAAATGVPVVALFGPTDPVVWAPRGPNVQTIVSSSGRMHDLEVSRILPRILQQLA